MKFYYFGIPQPGNWILDEASKTDCPEGQPCDYCGEEIKFEEAGYGVALGSAVGSRRLYAHNNCFVVAYGIIPIYPWHDEEGMTVKQVADEAVKEWLEDASVRRQGVGVEL